MIFHYQSFTAYLALASSLAVLGGLILAVAVYLYSIVVGLIRHPDNFTPQKYQEEFPKNNAAAKSPGWPNYTHRQLGADLRTLNTCSWGVYRSLWRRAHRRYNTGMVWWLLLFPLPIMTFLSLFAAWFFMVAQAFIFLTAFVLVWLVGGLIYWMLVLATRIVDGVWRKIFGGQSSCPQCYMVMPYPAFTHPGCNTVHSDVRSATAGILYRRCRCRKLLPITVVRSAWRLNACCQRCGESLPRGSSALRGLRISIFGDINAGKTRFMFAALANLGIWARARKLRFLYADKQSGEIAYAARRSIRASEEIATTNEFLPRGVSCQIGGALLHIFDTAGQRFQDANMHDDLSYLGDAHGLVFVIDPFSLDSIRSILQQRGLTQLLESHPVRSKPEDLYGAVVSRIRAAGTRQRGQKLAVVVTKVDILTQVGVEIPSTHSELVAWLYEFGQHNMVVAAEREFSHVRYFASSSSYSAGSNSSDDLDPSAPLRWFMNSRRYSNEIKVRSSVR